MDDKYLDLISRDRAHDFEHREWELRRSFLVQRQRNVANMMKYSLIMFAAVIVVMYLIVPIKGILEKYEERMSAEVEGMQQIPSLKKELATLQKQLSALTTESVENRLHLIEENIRVGKIDPVLV